MAMLTLSNIGVSFGDFDLFQGVFASLPKDGKVGLVGPNGIGKTTLIRVIAGAELPSAGEVHTAKATRIGYLHQEAMQAFLGQNNTLFDEMLTVFDELRAQEKLLQEMETRLATGELDDEELAHYSRQQSSFELAGGYDYEVQIHQILTGLGFQTVHYQLPLAVLSGGQKTRALLARLLLEKPDLLILDEPTNHLDIQAVEWLEGKLRLWEGAVLIISHDRYFLDRIVNTIWELSRAGLESYRGNYSHYVKQRVERWANRQAEFDMVQERFLKDLDFIKRNIARDATKGQAVGRLKRLIREVRMMQVGGTGAILNSKWSEARSEFDISSSKWEVPDVESAIKSLPRPSGAVQSMSMRLQPARRSGGMVLRTEALHVGYPDHSLFKADDIELRRQERIALIGGNGTGKTTFLRAVLNATHILGGEIRMGESIDIGYFAQAHDDLKHDETVLASLMEKSGWLIPESRSYLGRFMFRGDDVFKPISMLSGGERGRLALAQLSLMRANFLLLDEPTNHLDIPTQEILEDALLNYDGTILMVSHDRYLVASLATQIWEVAAGRLRVYKCGYAEYLEMKSAEKQAVNGIAKSEVVVRVEKSAESAKPKLSKNEIRRREQQLAEIEKQITQKEKEFKKAEEALHVAATSNDFAKIQGATELYHSAEEVLNALMQEWESLAELVAENG